MKVIESLIQDVISDWNETLKQENCEYRVEMKVNCRVKKFYLNKKDFYEQRIGELSLFQVGKPQLLLWRKELQMPAKVKNTPQHIIEDETIRLLFRYFLFEAVGIFCNTTHLTITNQDYAEYDIEKDRLKCHPSAEGMVVKTLSGGDFYEKDNEFDVFMQNDKFYWVYTAHDIAKRNNGIWKIPVENAMITQNATPRIITLDQL